MIGTVTLNPSLDEWMVLPTLHVGTLNRASGFARYPGGKGINVSRVVRELGESTVAFALAGGEDGLILRELMNQLALPHEFVSVEGPTRNNYKIRTTSPRALTEINTAGPIVSRARLQTLQRRVLAHVRQLRCVALCGSLPPGAPPTIYGQWIRVLRHRGVPTVLDASGSAFRHGVLARPWLVKPNRQEAEEFLGKRLRRFEDVARAAHALVRRGPSLAILSLGKDGALLASRTPLGVWLARSPVVKVDSAVGSGDSLIGGFLVGWVQRRGLLESFRLGIACGTAAAMTPGTELCHRAAVRRLLPHVHIRQLT